MTDPTGHAEIVKSKDGWRWRLRGLNAEIVATSESYTRREDALRGLEDAQLAFANPLIDAGD